MAVELDTMYMASCIKIAAGHHSGRLVVDAALEAGGAPVDKLNSKPFGRALAELV
jgi:hypothetical protein